MSRREEDVATEMFIINSHDYVLFFTDKGRVYRLKCYEVPEGSRQSKGINIANILPIAPDEKVTSMIRVHEFDEEKFLVMVTRHGIIKRIALNAYNTARKGGLIALELNEGDELAWVRMTDGNANVIICDPLQGDRCSPDGKNGARRKGSQAQRGRPCCRNERCA